MIGVNDILIEDIDDDDSKKNGDIKKNNMKKKKKIRKLNIFITIISLILLPMIVINNFLIFKYDVLPFKYLIIYLILVDFLPLILIFLAFKKSKKKVKVFKIFISIIEIVYIIFLGFAFFYLNKTFNFLDQFTSNYKYESKNYVVVVLKDSSFNNIKDLDNKKIGYVNQVGIKVQKAIEKLADEITYQEEVYKEYNIMLNDLDNNILDGSLLGDAYYQMLREDDDSFNDKYKVIYSFTITEKIDDITKDVDITKDTFNIYISGIDSYGNVNSLTRSDVNIVVSINPKTEQILMINIPRDYYVDLYGTGQKDKLTHAGI